MFDTPLLSDFSYGEFIASSNNGAYFSYLNALEELTVKKIRFLFEKLYKKYGLDLNERSCFHSVFGKCSDMIEGRAKVQERRQQGTLGVIFYRATN